MSSPQPSSSPARLGAHAAGGLVVSVLASAVIGGAAIAASSWDTTSPTGAGAYVGRVGAQRFVLDTEPTALGLPIWAVVALQVPLWASLAGAVWLAGDRRWATVADRFGVRFARRDAPLGVGAGAVAQLAIVPLLYLVLFRVFDEADVSGPARALTDRAGSVWSVLLLVVGVGLVAPVVEELFFRGLVLRALEPGLGARWALVASSVVFAGVHFQLLQFPALLVFGLIAGTLAQRQGRLGGAIWAHIAFNMVTVVLLVGST